MTKLEQISNAQYSINVFQDSINYVSHHKEEWVIDPQRHFVRNVEGGLTYETAFKAPFTFGDESVASCGEEASEPYSGSQYSKKRQYIKPEAYSYVFERVNNSIRTYMTFQGKRILAVDGSDQAVYGKAGYKKVQKLMDLILKADNMISQETYDKKSLLKLAAQAKRLYKSCKIDANELIQEITRLEQLNETGKEDLSELACILSDLNLKAKKKQEPFLITYKNGDSRYAVHINILYDCLTQLFLGYQLQPGVQINEDAALIELVRKMKLDPAECIITLDRGYERMASFYILDNSGFFFVCRIKDVTSSRTFLKELNLPCDQEFSQVITIRLIPDTRKAIHRRNGFTGPIKTVSGPDAQDIFRDREYVDLKIRIVRFKLINPDGSVSWQMAATNLDEEEYSIEDIKHIYHCRWAIEESINFLKNKLDIKNLHGRKMETIQQELYAKMTVYNLTSVNRNEIEQEEKLGQWSIPEEEPVQEPDVFRFIDIPRLEYHGPLSSDGPEDPEAVDPDFQKLEERTVEEIEKADKKAEEYMESLGFSGVSNKETNIDRTLITPKNGNKYAYTLNFSVLITLTRRYMFDPRKNAAEIIHRRAMKHKVAIKLNKPDTRKKYQNRKVQKASGDYHHSESRIDVKQSA